MRATTDRAVSVLTVDDQPVFRGAARAVIEATPGFEAVAEAASGEEALELFAALEPDLVLMGARMAGMDGFEAARRLRAAHPQAVVALISLEDPDDVDALAHGCGAAMTLRKQDFSPAMLRRLWETRRRS